MHTDANERERICEQIKVADAKNIVYSYERTQELLRMYSSRDPFPECATYYIEDGHLSLSELSAMFNNRARSSVHKDLNELGIKCTSGVNKDSAWTLYVFMAWYQFMKNLGVQKVYRHQYWRMCTPDHLREGKCSAETASDELRMAFVTKIGKSYEDFEKLWEAQMKSRKRVMTVDV